MQEKQRPIDLLVQAGLASSRAELERMAEEEDDYPEDDLPARLRRLMDELDVSQQQLAAAAGVSVHTIKTVLKGRHSIMPAPSTMDGIVFALSPEGGLGGTVDHVVRFSLPLVRMFLAYERSRQETQLEYDER
jgi:transcriptional regulator with XRE-family HTH domain